MSIGRGAVIITVIGIASVAAWFSMTIFGGGTTTLQPPVLPEDVRQKLDALTPEREQPLPQNVPVLVDDAPDVALREPLVSAEKAANHPVKVSGRVADENGTPIAGARIELGIGPYFRENPAQASYLTVSGPEGAYQIEGITTFGEAVITCRAEGFVASGSRWYGSGAPELRQVLPNRHYDRMDFRLYHLWSTIRGNVIDQARLPVPGASVIVAKQFGKPGSQGWPLAVSDATGAFELDLSGDGECVLRVQKGGYATGVFAPILPPAEGLVLKISGGGTIAGTVSDEEMAPVEGLEVVVQGEQSKGKKVASDWESVGERTAMTDERGQYVVTDLSPDFTYTVEVPYKKVHMDESQRRARTLEEFLAIKGSASRAVEMWRLNADDSPYIGVQKGVSVVAGRETRVDFTAKRNLLKAASIQGTVTDPSTGAPAFPVMIYAVSENDDGDNSLLGITTTQEGGAYALDLPGLTETTPLCLRAGYPTDTSQLSYSLTDYDHLSELTCFSLAPGEKREVNFKIPSTITVPVRLVSPTGEPVQGLTVSQVVSGADGRLVLFGLAPYATHRLTATIDVPGGYVVCGTGAPFSGKPGQVLAEQEIVCDTAMSSLTGQLMLPKGIDEFPAPRLGCRIYYEGREPVYLLADITPSGYITVNTVAPGTCTILFFVLTEEPDLQWWALIENVKIPGGQTVDLGSIVPQPPAYQ